MPLGQIYSQQLLNVNGLHGTAAFVVPNGFILVVRDVEIFEGNPGGALVEVSGEDGVVFVAFGPILTTTYNNYRWEGRVVVSATKQFEVDASLPVNVLAMGYLLTAP